MLQKLKLYFLLKRIWTRELPLRNFFKNFRQYNKFIKQSISDYSLLKAVNAQYSGKMEDLAIALNGDYIKESNCLDVNFGNLRVTIWEDKNGKRELDSFVELWYQDRLVYPHVNLQLLPTLRGL